MTNRVFAYNPSHTPIPGTDQVGDLAIGVISQDYSANPGGVIWWGGPDEDLGYVICGPVPSGDRSTPIGNIGTVRFWRSKALTDESFLELVNKLTNGRITDAYEASQWLIDNGYWSSWVYTPYVSFVSASSIIKSDNTTWAWGLNQYGRIGDNTTTSRITPVSILGNKKTFCSIVGDAKTTLSIDNNGLVWGWGYNFGTIGDNTNANRVTPVSVHGNKKTFCKISIGSDSGTNAIDKNGMVWGWGQNSSGGIGDNSGTRKDTPVSIHGNKKTFCEIHKSYGTGHGIEYNGQMWGWGLNTHGQVGNNSTTAVCTPVSILGNKKTFCKISGNINADLIALDNNGQVWCWGRNTEGQIGDGTTTSRLTPVSILGNKKTFCKVGGGVSHSTALDNHGQIWSWGSNGNGALGDNTTTNRCTPVSLLGNKKTFCMISTGYGTQFAIDIHGNLWGWGLNTNGQIGDNSIIARLTPVRVYGL